jgi:hypothetical protein
VKLKWKRVLPVCIAVILLVAAAVSVAFAHEPTESQPGTPFLGGWFGRRWFGKRGPGGGGFILGYIKGKTNVDLKTLLDALRNGKTLDEIASQYGLDLGALKGEIAANAPKAVFEGLDKETAVILSYIARKANVSVEALVNEYKGGKSLEAIAAEHGVDLPAIKQEIATCLAGVKGNKDAWAILCYIAGKANVDLKTLVDEYQNGKSLEAIAAEHGLDLAAIQAAIDAARPAGKPGGMVKRFGSRFGLGVRGGRQKGNGVGTQSNKQQGPKQNAVVKGL